MTNKRSRAEMEDLEGVHKSRQVNLAGAKRYPQRKPRHSLSSTIKPNAVNPLKKKIRDVSRLLERSESLPPGVRIENERALASYKLELADAADEKRRQKMIKKYHMVRFFERQKATRQLKQLQKQLASSTSSAQLEELKEQIHIVKVDLNYALYCPLDQKYVSLYKPKDEKDEKDEKDNKGSSADNHNGLEKPPLWKEVEDRMKNGTLDELRNSRSTVSEALPKTDTVQQKDPNRSAESTARPPKNNGLNNTKTRKVKRPPSPDDHDSDGGFFEE